MMNYKQWFPTLMTYKQWLPTVLFALGGFLALIMGFVAAFAPLTNGRVSLSMSDMYKGSTNAISSKIMTTLYISHIGMVYIGGMVAGVLGLLSLGAAAFIGYTTYRGNFARDKDIIVTFVLVFSLSVAALVCKSDISDVTWIAKHGIKIPTP